MKLKQGVYQGLVILGLGVLLLPQVSSATNQVISINSVGALRSTIRQAVQDKENLELVLTESLRPSNTVPQEGRGPTANVFPTIRDIEVTIDCQGHKLKSNRESNQAMRAFHIKRNAKLSLKNCHVEDFSVTNGPKSQLAVDQRGGAILAEEGSELILDNVSFRRNWAYYGGAIDLVDAKASITNSSFINNAVFHRTLSSSETYPGIGGAIAATGSPIQISNSAFIKNSSGNFKALGGAIFFNGGQLTIENTTFGENGKWHGTPARPSKGGAINMIAGDVSCNHCSFVSNYADDGGAFFIDSPSRTKATVTNSLFDGNLSNPRTSDVCRGTLDVKGTTVMTVITSPFQSDCSIRDHIIANPKNETWIVNQAGPIVENLVEGSGLDEGFYPIRVRGRAADVILATNCLEFDQRGYRRISSGVEACDAGAIELESSQEPQANLWNRANDLAAVKPNPLKKTWNLQQPNEQGFDTLGNRQNPLNVVNQNEAAANNPNPENPEDDANNVPAMNPFDLGAAESPEEPNLGNTQNASGCSLQPSKARSSTANFIFLFVFGIPAWVASKKMRAAI